MTYRELRGDRKVVTVDLAKQPEIMAGGFEDSVWGNEIYKMRNLKTLGEAYYIQKRKRGF